MAFARDPMNPGAPVHPGEFLREDLFLPLGLSEMDLASDLGLSPDLIHELLEERIPLNAEVAYRLALYFGMDVRTWMNWQVGYDLAQVYSDRFERLRSEVRPRVSSPELAGAA